MRRGGEAGVKRRGALGGNWDRLLHRRGINHRVLCRRIIAHSVPGWVVLLALFGGALFGRPRPAAIGGIAAALALDQAAMAALEIRFYGGDGLMFPFVYLFSLPGAILGALVMIVWLTASQQRAPFASFCISAAAVLAGVAINQAVVCNTVISYCPMPWAIHQGN